MLEAHHYTAAAARKGAYALPEEFDGTVNLAVLYSAVGAQRNNRRQGTHSTKTRAEVSGGSRKPWRQKGTGRARQGTIRAPHWTGGGVVFGPKPRDYTTKLPRKVKQLARQSALNQRAKENAITVIEALTFEGPKTRRMVELLEALELGGRKTLVLTADVHRDAYLSGRNLPNVHVLRYADASPYDILWSEHLVIEEAAIGGHAVRGKAAKVSGTADAAAKKTKRAGRAVAKRARTAAKKTTKKATGTKKAGGAKAKKATKKKKA